MIDPQYIELIHREVDGVNSPAEQQTLYEYLQAHPEAQRLLDDLRVMTSALEEIEEVDPPPALKARILNLLDIGAQKSSEPAGGWFGRLAETWGSRRYAYVFSAGVAVGAIVFLITLGIPVAKEDSARLTGTIISGKTTDFVPGDALHASSPEADVRIETKHAGEIVVADLSVQSREPVDVLFTVDGIDMCFTAFKQSEGATGQLTVNENTSRLTTVGNQHYLVFFTDRSASGRPLHVRVEKNGRSLYEKTLLPRRQQ